MRYRFSFVQLPCQSCEKMWLLNSGQSMETTDNTNVLSGLAVITSAVQK
jgi:hypothetical protein